MKNKTNLKFHIIVILVILITYHVLGNDTGLEVVRREIGKDTLVENNKHLLDTIQQNIALDYLDSVRNNPGSFSGSIGVDLSYVEPQHHRLVWNDTLAYLAQRKAIDMVENDYFSHADLDGITAAHWVMKFRYHKLAFSATNAIRGLIIDKDWACIRQRNHLLGVGTDHERRKYCGIGVAHTRDFKFWCVCVLISE